MNDIHSFLRQIKDHIIRFCKKREGRQAAFTAYVLTGVVLLLDISGILAVERPAMIYAKELGNEAAEQNSSLCRNMISEENLKVGQSQTDENDSYWYIDNKNAITRLNISNVILAYPIVMDSLIQDVASTSVETAEVQNTVSDSVATTTVTATTETASKTEETATLATNTVTGEDEKISNSIISKTVEETTRQTVEVAQRKTTDKVISKTTEKVLSEVMEQETIIEKTAEKKTTEKITAEKTSTAKATQKKTTADTAAKTETETKKTNTAEKTSTKKSENTVKSSTIPEGLVKETNKEMKMELSNKQLEVLQRIVEAEAGGEDIYGKILVANVVLNRVLSDEFPDTVKEVVFQKTGNTYQFSPIKDGRYASVTVSDSTKKAVKRALKGEDYSKGALYFFARKKTTTVKASWFDTSLQKLLKYGNHEFYGNK